MIKLVDILEYVRKNENSAFFHTPVIYKNARSYFLKSPEIVLELKDKTELNGIMAQADALSRNKNMTGIALIPYETGYLFQSGNVQRRFRRENAGFNLTFMFYNKDNIRIINSNNIDYNNVDNYITKKTEYENIKLNLSKKNYIEAINEIKNHIAEGNCYQINYTAKLKFDINELQLIPLFLTGIFNQSSAYTAFINTEKHYILSFSPELFFETDYNILKSKPMKGTVKRGKNDAEDKIIIQTLLTDEKNLAENVMIVDLLRNDIGKIPGTGSVTVPQLYEVEKYETLYQLTSTVTGKLNGVRLSGIIKNLFPCGSITGAPKIKTMEIINKLEREPRGIYTGSIGLLTSEKAVFNIAIRTLSVNKKNMKAGLGLGSGIVWDSVPGNEFDEVLLKGNFLLRPAAYFELLETFLFEDGKYFLLEAHLKRLQETANYFLFKYNKLKILKLLENTATKLTKNKKYKIRLTLDKWGNVKIRTGELQSKLDNAKVLMLERKPGTDEKFYYHKTTFRPWDEDLKNARNNGFTEIIFINDKNQLLEGAISNIFINKNNSFFTPHSALPILKGCYRDYLLKKTNATEKILTVDDLKTAGKIILCNSVRKEFNISEIYDNNGNLVYKA